MVDLTVIILTKNEEKNLPKAIKSVKNIAKKILVIDSFSDDKTVEIAKDLGCDVYQHKWATHAKQFNWALENMNINTEWIMRLDADEEILPELSKEIISKLPKLENHITGIMIKRRLYFMNKWIKHGGYYPTWLLRIFRKGNAKSEQKIMDEHIILLEGKVMKFENDFIDKNNKSLSYWISKHNWYSDREAFEILSSSFLKEESNLVKSKLTGNFNERKRWLKENIYLKLPRGFRAWLYYIYRYYFKLGFLDGKEGKIFHFLQAYWYRFLVDAKIYETERYGNIEDLRKNIFSNMHD